MTRPIRVGVQLWPGGAPTYRSWRDAVLRAEQAGVDAIFGYDHFHRPEERATDDGAVPAPEQPEANNFEGWTALASWAELTTRVEIGLLVSGIGFRNPDLLADMARTVDHISGGRLILGLGAGWYEKDYSEYEYEYGTVGSRMTLFEQGIRRIEHRLTQLKPPPTRRIPVLIGGSGEKRTLPLVGRHTDIWHSFLDIETFRRKNDLVRGYAAEAGRDADTIERAVGWSGPADAEAYAGEGVTLFTISIKPTSDGYDLSGLDELIKWREHTGSL